MICVTLVINIVSEKCDYDIAYEKYSNDLVDNKHAGSLLWLLKSQEIQASDNGKKN